MRLAAFNALTAAEAGRELLRCCGSTRWAAAMAAARPFADVKSAQETADRIGQSLGAADWLEAFAAHPRIGERQPSADPAPGSRPESGGWSAQEQAGVTDGSRSRFLQLNRLYEDRFGYIFIVCATGKSGGEMAAILERRLANDPGTELREAAGEQQQITRLRLAKLFGD